MPDTQTPPPDDRIDATDHAPGDVTGFTTLNSALRDLGQDLSDALDEGALMCGPYRLMLRIGEGGYGEVFSAVNEAVPDQRVAVKILKHGRDTREILRRFDLEKRALARIEHPCIATIIGAGMSSDGRPWFSMPLINGNPITIACQTLRLPFDRRIEMFARACDGVHAAHVQGIVHRDLKPGNILLAQGQDGQLSPKIIDFGIAKALDDTEWPSVTLTAESVRLGTPKYMAPEQSAPINATADTRSDVYALGVILKELIDAPLAGDLHAIVAKATMPEPALRYQSADGLAADLRRVLEHQPVTARAPGTVYLARRFIRRHRSAVLASALVLAVVTTLGSLSVLNAYRAHQADLATALEGKRAIRTADVLQGMLAGIDPEVARGKDRTLLVELLRNSARELLVGLHTEDEVVLGRVGAMVGQAFSDLEEPNEALAVLRPIADKLSAAVNAAEDGAARTQLKFEFARVSAAIGTALRTQDALADGGGESIHLVPESAEAWQMSMDTLAEIGQLEDPLALQTAMRLWVAREPWPKTLAFAAFEAWLKDRMAMLPDDDPTKWTYRLREAEIRPWNRLIREYPPVVDQFATRFGEDHPRVVRARVRQLSFLVGAAIESKAEPDMTLDVPRWSDAELLGVWKRAAEFGAPVVARSEAIFGKDHNHTHLARLSQLAAVGHSQGAAAARPLFDLWRAEAVASRGEDSKVVAQFDTVWRGINEGVAFGKWWIGIPKGGAPGLN